MTMSKLSLLQTAAVNGKTTAGLALTAAAYLIKEFAVPLLDGQDFAGLVTPEVIDAALSLVMAAGIAITGIFARDADKSSQDNQVRDPITKTTVAIEVDRAVDEALGRK